MKKLFVSWKWCVSMRRIQYCLLVTCDIWQQYCIWIQRTLSFHIWRPHLFFYFLTNPFPLCHKMYVLFVGKKWLLLDTPSPLCGRPVWKPRNHHTIEASKYPLYFPYKITRVIFSYELYYKICTSSASHICKPSLNNLASERFGNLPNKATESLHFHWIMNEPAAIGDFRRYRSRTVGFTTCLCVSHHSE